MRTNFEELLCKLRLWALCFCDMWEVLLHMKPLSPSYYAILWATRRPKCIDRFRKSVCTVDSEEGTCVVDNTGNDASVHQSQKSAVLRSLEWRPLDRRFATPQLERATGSVLTEQHVRTAFMTVLT